MHPARLSLQRGLTLIEIGIVLAVLAIVGTIALPSLGARFERQRLETAAQRLAADLADARFESTQRGQTWFVHTEDGPAWCWSVSAQPDCPCGTAAACQIHAVRAADHPGVHLHEPAVLRLDPAGATAQANATRAATFSSPRGDKLRVETSALGRPRVCALAGSWPRLPAC